MRTSYKLAEHLRGRGGVFTRLQVLDQTQRLSSVELAELQRDKLARLIIHSYNTVPYYRRIMDERGLRPNDVTSVNDLSKLPVLTRALLLKHQKELISSEADSATLKQNFSSGSTGQRASFYQDENFRLWMRAHQLRTYSWCNGWEPGDRFTLLWGSEIFWSGKALSDKLFNVLTNRRELNTFKLSQPLVRRFVDELERFDPILISSYSNALHLIAKEIESRGVRLPSLKAVQGTSEPMTPEMRSNIGRAFGSEVFDKYGSRETNIVSHECPTHNGMLVQVENVVVETIGDDGINCDIGHPGRVILTTLNNNSMPLIRYETSDIAALETRPTRGPFAFPTISAVAGRLQDLIVTPDGSYIDSYFFSYLIMQFDEIDWFQVVQKEAGRLIFRIVSSSGLSSARSLEIIELVQRHTKYAFLIDFDFLGEMPISSTGKFRLCVSDMPAAQMVRDATGQV